MAHSYSHLYGLPATGLRFFTVYGPWGRPDMSPMLFTRAILAGEPIKVFNHGRMRRDFTYVDDIVEGVLRVLELPPEGGDGAAPHAIYNIGNHQAVELEEFIAHARAPARPDRRKGVPADAGRATFRRPMRRSTACGRAPASRRARRWPKGSRASSPGTRITIGSRGDAAAQRAAC